VVQRMARRLRDHHRRHLTDDRQGQPAHAGAPHRSSQAARKSIIRSRNSSRRSNRRCRHPVRHHHWREPGTPGEMTARGPRGYLVGAVMARFLQSQPRYSRREGARTQRSPAKDCWLRPGPAVLLPPAKELRSGAQDTSIAVGKTPFWLTSRAAYAPPAPRNIESRTRSKSSIQPTLASGVSCIPSVWPKLHISASPTIG
jgi:hypothetical protein